MISISRTHAENRFSAIEKRQQKALSEQEEKTLKIAENTARLKTLRLAKEAADLADAATPKTAAKKPAKKRVLA